MSGHGFTSVNNAAISKLEAAVDVACNCLNVSGRGSIADQLRAAFQPISSKSKPSCVHANGRRDRGFLLPKAD